MIVVVLKAEKEEREKRKMVGKFVEGIDKDKFIKADGRIKGAQALSETSVRVMVQKPAKGNHKLAKNQTLYEDISAFIAAQAWIKEAARLQQAGLRGS